MALSFFTFYRGGLNNINCLLISSSAGAFLFGKSQVFHGRGMEKSFGRIDFKRCFTRFGAKINLNG
jgi:hypothetical protein